MGVAEPEKTNALNLWYDEPAEYFINALPIGDGRLAAVTYDRPSEEMVHMNEETQWSGGPVYLNPNPSSSDYLPKVRKALDADNYARQTSCIARSILKSYRTPVMRYDRTLTIYPIN
jgi:hypothetical protein